MPDDDNDWTTEGYGTAIIALGLPTRLTYAGMACPRWAGSLVLLLTPHLTEDAMLRVLREVQHHPHRARLVTVARLGGWAALRPMLDAAR